MSIFDTIVQVIQSMYYHRGSLSTLLTPLIASRVPAYIAGLKAKDARSRRHNNDGF